MPDDDDSDSDRARRWPQVIVKDLIENALDAAEKAGIAPAIGIEVDEGRGAFGNPSLGPNNRKAAIARAEAVRLEIIETMHLSTLAAADELNRRGIRTASGKQWHAMQVHRVRQRLGLTDDPGK
jgi:hypothetical protein